ncbi:IS4 family transposase [Fimbriiglobus ruber]|uniref:Mobile element protein n=1 Tax=Fimbriiglobus ruber TaxID=1908690 RepID=A0A225DD55_9BACT|nr:IS4 family transposase [Fimbriiglobus ruber]OWK35256.1 Mobile element protein [Fimbriiglobus ruber]
MARTFVLGFLQKPSASDEELAQLATQAGAPVTPQAIDQRHTPRLVQFLETLFRKSTTVVVGSTRALAPILERFPTVTILDSSTITLPDELGDRFAGCGGSYGRGAAALKLQTELDLRSGALSAITVESGRIPDGASARQHVIPPAGGLRITDLGYYSLAVFAPIAAGRAYFLSRLGFGTGVRVASGGPTVDLLPWLAGQPGPYVDAPVWLGEKRLGCRLLAWRLPDEPANRRRQKLRAAARAKGAPEPSAARLAWCEWTLLVTNVPGELLTPPEAVVLYRARWQVELLFKRWKSQDLVAVLSGATVVRQMVRVWSRLLAAVVQHWLVVATAWGDATRSWVKVSEAVRAFVGRLVGTLDDPVGLARVLSDLGQVVGKTCRRNKRRKPGTAELLNDVSLLDFSLFSDSPEVTQVGLEQPGLDSGG